MNICPSPEGNNFSFPCRHQTLHFTREIWHLKLQSFTKGDGMPCRAKHREGSLGGHEGRPGGHALLKSDDSSCIFREGPVIQCLANLHEPVAIPAIHMIAPGLTGWIKADPSRIWVMGTTLLARGKRTCPCFSGRRIVGMKSNVALHTFTLRELCFRR